MTARHFTVWNYFAATWWGLLACALGTGYMAELFRPAMLIAAASASFLALTPSGPKKRARQLLAFFRLVFPPALAFFAIVQFLAEKDTLCFIAEMLLSFLPFILSFRTKTLGYWLSVWTLFLLALTGVVAEAELPEYLFFIGELALIVANLNAANLFFLAGQSRAKTHLLPPGYFRQFVGAGFAGFSIGALIFVLFPRDIAWSSPFGVRQKFKTTGYSGTVSLDGTPEIRESTTLVFQLQSSDPVWASQIGTNLYFRGNVLEQFDGTNWSPRLERMRPFRDSRPLAFSRPAGTHLSRVTIYREPSSVRVVFYPWLLQSIDFLGSYRPALGYDSASTLYLANPEFRRYAYEVAVLPPALQKDWATTPLPGHRAGWVKDPRFERYLEIPEVVATADYFKNWVKEVFPHPQGQHSYAELVRTLKEHFREKYVPTFKHEYTGPSAFASFLTDSRKGHCEYFASAAALFFRQMGIPSRIVVGYYGGSYNPVSQVVEVRELNAHAWVEIFEPHLGWVTVDPTPPVKTPPSALPVQWFLSYASAAEFWFNRYVIHYNAATQKSLVRNFWRDLAGTFSVRPTGLSSSLFRGLSWDALKAMRAKLLCLLAMGLALGLLLRRRQLRRQAQQGPRLPAYYRRLERRLKRHSLTRRQSESHRAFLTRARTVLPPALASQVIHCLETDLYAPDSAPATDQAELHRLIRALK